MRVIESLLDAGKGQPDTKLTLLNPTWRFMGSYKWGYKPLNMGYNYSYSAYNATYTYP